MKALEAANLNPDLQDSKKKSLILGFCLQSYCPAAVFND